MIIPASNQLPGTINPKPDVRRSSSNNSNISDQNVNKRSRSKKQEESKA